MPPNWSSIHSFAPLRTVTPQFFQPRSAFPPPSVGFAVVRTSKLATCIVSMTSMLTLGTPPLQSASCLPRRHRYSYRWSPWKGMNNAIRALTLEETCLGSQTSSLSFVFSNMSSFRSAMFCAPERSALPTVAKNLHWILAKRNRPGQKVHEQVRRNEQHHTAREANPKPGGRRAHVPQSGKKGMEKNGHPKSS